jgi:Domain of unknown function (DUF4327)
VEWDFSSKSRLRVFKEKFAMFFSGVNSMALSTIQYSIDAIVEEARHLVQKGVVSRQQPIYTLCRYIPAREWACVEEELEQHDFLLRDRIGDLMGEECWDND